MSLDQETKPTSPEQILLLNPETQSGTVDQIRIINAEVVRAVWAREVVRAVWARNALKTIDSMIERGRLVSQEMANSILEDVVCLHNPDETSCVKTWSMSLLQSIFGSEKAEYVGIAEIRTHSDASLLCAGHEGAAYLLRFIKFDKTDLNLEEEYPKALNQLVRFLRNYVSSKFPGVSQHLYFEGNLRSLNPSLSIEDQKQFYLDAGFEETGKLLHLQVQ